MKNKIILFLVLLCSTHFLSSASVTPILSHRKVTDLIHWRFIKGNPWHAQYTEFNDMHWAEVAVPHTYSHDAITDVGYYQGAAWYRTKLQGSQFSPEERVFIRFEGVGESALVYLNGKSVGNHAGSYSAFCFELTKQWDYNGTNVLAVKVDNETNYKTIPVDNFLFNNYGGIYRPAAIFSTPKNHISPLYSASPGVFVELKEKGRKEAIIELRTHVEVGETSNASLVYIIKDNTGRIVAQAEQTLPSNQTKEIPQIQKVSIPKPVYWQGKTNPYLYSVEVELNGAGKKDVVEQNFGLRFYNIDPNTGFALNNVDYPLHGVCRHQEWKDEAVALTYEHHKADIDLMLEMGVTGLRLAHYQQADDMYRLADEEGIVVWAEIPQVHSWSGREQANAKQQLTELILQNYNHPSICFWGLWNEVRAYNGEKTPCVVLTKQLNALAHRLDPSRVTTSASDRPMGSPMTGISDLQAWNKYFGWYYGEYKDLGSWLDKLHAEHPQVKISVSEYGAGGTIGHQDASHCEKAIGNYFPEQELSICHEESWRALKDRDFVWGSFLWNMFDFSVNKWYRGGTPHMNHKGLITYDRKHKKDAFYFYKANWNPEPMMHLCSKRDVERNDSERNVKVYSNLGVDVHLFINGELVSKKVADDVQLVEWTELSFVDGFNRIEVRAEHKGEVYVEKSEFTFVGANKLSNIDK